MLPGFLRVYIASTGNGSNEDLSDSMNRYTRVLSELPCTCLKLSSLSSDGFNPLVCRTEQVAPAAWQLPMMKYVTLKDTSVEQSPC